MENITPQLPDEIEVLRAENQRMKELIGLLTAKAEDRDAIKSRLDYYRRQKAKAKMEDDLRRIKTLDPSVMSLDELGEDYLRLVKNGIDGPAAFLALKGVREMEALKEPPYIGTLDGRAAGTDLEYFTSSELDSLTGKDLDNPAILKKAIKSLSRL